MSLELRSIAGGIALDRPTLDRTRAAIVRSCRDWIAATEPMQKQKKKNEI